jgi:UPF0176 protein
MGEPNSKPLHNKVNRDELKEHMRNSIEERITISFYKYQHIPEPKVFRNALFKKFLDIDVQGRIYVAEEGINAQISIPTAKLDLFRESLYSFDGFDGIRLNIAVDDDGKSFFTLAIKVRKKIVADGLDDSTFDSSDTGAYLNAEAFNRMVADDDTILVDMRNHYESEVGHFKNAICPDVDTFREELPAVEEMLTGKEDKNIVMYCTGGIRCEKATAYFKHKGFGKVHHLEGGIIKYAHDVKEQGLENKFVGKNFVFDERLGERISEEVIATCHQCGKSCDNHTNCSNDACHILFIQCDSCKETYNDCCSIECKDIYELPEEEQKELRAGKKVGRQVFKKGRIQAEFDENGLIQKSLKAD